MGAELGLLGREQEALAASDEAVRRFGNSDDVATLECVVFALLNKGNTLARLNRAEEALAAYDEIVERFEEHDCGYEVADDCDALRSDPLFRLPGDCPICCVSELGGFNLMLRRTDHDDTTT